MNKIIVKNQFMVNGGGTATPTIEVVKGNNLLTDKIREELENFNKPIYWSDDRMCHWFFDYKIGDVWVSNLNIDEDFNIVVELFKW